KKIGTIQRRLAWPLHKDDTLSRSGRPTGLNIYFACYIRYMHSFLLATDILGVRLRCYIQTPTWEIVADCHALCSYGH
ncbi:hypothetical protein C8Q73DRAFT_654905, partial [Cubamyces lactineus]